MQLDHARDTNANFDLFLTYSGMLDTRGLAQVSSPPHEFAYHSTMLMFLEVSAACRQQIRHSPMCAHRPHRGISETLCKKYPGEFFG